MTGIICVLSRGADADAKLTVQNVTSAADPCKGPPVPAQLPARYITFRTVLPALWYFSRDRASGFRY